MPPAIADTEIKSLPLVCRGKVRDVYEWDSEHLLIVTSNRLSAFDVVFCEQIPDKGRILNQLSSFWFQQLHTIIPNHTCSVDPKSIDEIATSAELQARSMVVKKANPLPIEAIVRGYLIGSGWKEYCNTGAICNIRLPNKLKLAEQLPETLYTPSTKAQAGEHDINISFEKTVELLGKELAEKVREAALAVYCEGAAYALSRGIIIADTKLEFGLDKNGELMLIDELLTPDSSRFWACDSYHIGSSPPSFDKQFVRDYLERIGWDKTPPAPALPQDVIDKTAEKYRRLQTYLIG